MPLPRIPGRRRRQRFSFVVEQANLGEALLVDAGMGEPQVQESRVCFASSGLLSTLTTVG